VAGAQRKRPGPSEAQLREVIDMLGSFYTVRPASRLEFEHYFRLIQAGVPCRLDLEWSNDGVLEITCARAA